MNFPIDAIKSLSLRACPTMTPNLVLKLHMSNNDTKFGVEIKPNLVLWCHNLFVISNNDTKCNIIYYLMFSILKFLYFYYLQLINNYLFIFRLLFIFYYL